MILSGGKFLGQGTYGCVFFPSIQCSNKKQRKKLYTNGVSKVFESKHNMDEELKESRKVSRMDKNGLYTNKVLGNCDVIINDFSMEEKRACNKINTTPSYKQIIYEHRGFDLKEFMKKSYSLPQTYNYILNLLKGIQLLTKHEYSHLDLKPDNILISESNKALLIDFGLGRSFKDLYNIHKSDYLLEYEYIWYAPEFSLFINLHDLKEDIVRNFIDYNRRKFYGKFNGKHIEKESKDLIKNVLSGNIFNAKRRIDTKNLSSYFVTNFASKADVFAIGMVMYYILKNAKKDKNKKDYQALFEDIIYKAIRINPIKRANIDELIDDLEVLIKNSPPTALKPSIKFNNDNVSVVHPVNESNKSITSSIKNKKLNDCMKHKRPELVAMVDEYKLPKKLKQMRKQELCKELVSISKNKI